MGRALTAWAALAILAGAGALHAHHSIGMFDLAAPIWIRGTVIEYRPVNPHSMMTLEERRANGQVRRWTVEGPSLNRIDRLGAAGSFLKAGDVIEVCGFPFKEEFAARPLPDGSPRASVHGHVIVMPDGRMRLWGSYGKLDHCVRPGDRIQTWLDLLSAEPMARQAWCAKQTLVKIPSIAPPAFVDEVERRMSTPCD